MSYSHLSCISYLRIKLRIHIDIFSYDQQYARQHKLRRRFMSMQLEFFKTEEEIEIEKIKKTLDKVRKGTYANINEMKRGVEELKNRLEIIEKNICKGK